MDLGFLPSCLSLQVFFPLSFLLLGNSFQLFFFQANFLQLLPAMEQVLVTGSIRGITAK